MIQNILNAITGAISSTYSNVLGLLQTIFKSKKVNITFGLLLVDMFLVVRPEFEGFREPLIGIVNAALLGNVAAFGSVDVAMAVKLGKSKYYPESA